MHCLAAAIYKAKGQKTMNTGDPKLKWLSVVLGFSVLAATPTGAFAQTAPGGVSSGLSEWYDAGSGITQNTTGVTTAWTQRAGSGGETPLTKQGTTGSIDTIVNQANFNPALRYNNPTFLATGAFYSGTPTHDQNWITPAGSGSAFAAGLSSDQLSFLGRGGPAACASGTDTGRCNIGFRPDAQGTNFGGNPSLTAYASAGNLGPTVNVYGLWATGGASLTAGTHRNTRNGWTNTGSGLAKETASDYQFRIGSFPGFTYNGTLNEVIYYNRKLSETEAQQVTTYLGLKYGVTLDANATRNDATNFDYLSSFGMTVWAGNGATFGPYHRNVFGIGNDSALDQRIATNVNDSGPTGTYPLDILTMANGALSAPSQFTFAWQTSGSALASGQYLIVGNDGQPTTTTTSITVSNNTTAAVYNGAWTRLSRRWRAANTGAVGTVSLLFNVPASAVTALGGNLNNVVLLVDDDGNYTNGNTRIVTAGRSVSGNQISFNVTLANGEIFTLASATATIRIDKTTQQAAGTYSFTVTNATPVSGSVAVAASATASVDTDSTTAGIQPFAINAINTAVVATEAAPPAGVLLKSIVCTDLASGAPALTYTTDLTTRAATIPASSVHAGAQLVCTFTNVKTATVTLQKTWANAVVNDTASVTLTNTSSSVVVTTLSSTANTSNETDAAPAYTALVGDVYSLAETLGAGNAGLYNATLACTGTSGLSGTTLTIGASDSAIVCTYVNTRQSADLSITKTDNTTTAVSGSTTTYTLVVKNGGPASVTGAIVKDAPVTGLTCPTTNAVTCSGTGCPAGSLTMADLLSGITMGTMPANTTATFTFTCNVN